MGGTVHGQCHGEGKGLREPWKGHKNANSIMKLIIIARHLPFTIN